MSRLIILSNRVSLPQANKPSAGGLAVAMQDALSHVGGIWLGWSGEKVKDDQPQRFDILYKSKITYITCGLTQNQYLKYYCGFANNTLWPAMHDRSDLIEYDAEEYNVYQQVNQLFAQKLAQIAQPDDIIWVHDYHFLSVAKYCRDLGMRNKIGFFLHIPFASLSIWNKIPAANQLIRDLCQYDVVGLQTGHDQRSCMQVCTALLKAQKIHNSLLSFERHLTLIKNYPIGTDVDGIQKALDDASATTAEHDYFHDNEKTIIGVDRIDYSKGLFERFNAYAEFLENYPDYQEKIQHLQIASPCRLEVPAYKRLFERFKIKVDLINNEFGRENWYPIQCNYEVIDHIKLLSLYRQADICWISSLKDGMNLVAKEFIAAQDPKNPGVLVLSIHAGAAEQMQDALLVDPANKSEMIKALKTALDMPLQERQERYEKLVAGLRKYDIDVWRNAFLKDLKHHHFTQEFRYAKQPVQLYSNP